MRKSPQCEVGDQHQVKNSEAVCALTREVIERGESGKEIGDGQLPRTRSYAVDFIHHYLL